MSLVTFRQKRHEGMPPIVTNMQVLPPTRTSSRLARVWKHTASSWLHSGHGSNFPRVCCRVGSLAISLFTSVNVLLNGNTHTSRINRQSIRHVISSSTRVGFTFADTPSNRPACTTVLFKPFPVLFQMREAHCDCTTRGNCPFKQSSSPRYMNASESHLHTHHNEVLGVFAKHWI